MTRVSRATARETVGLRGVELGVSVCDATGDRGFRGEVLHRLGISGQLLEGHTVCVSH